MDRKRSGIEDEIFWVEEFRYGNEQALAWFFDLHYKPLCYFCIQLTGEPGEGEDIVANCFIKLWQKNKDFKTAQNIKAFLYISCRNECLDYLKHLKRKNNAQLPYFTQQKNSEDEILNHIIEAELLQILSEEIEHLPLKCRQIFKLIYFDGLKTNEIADQLSLSVKTVRNQKAIAVELLKTTFLKKGILGLYPIFMVLINKQ